MLRDCINVSLTDSRPQVLIVTRHDHLHQVFVAKFSIIIRIEILHDIRGVSLSRLFDTIVSIPYKVMKEIKVYLPEELEHFKRSDLTVLVTIDPLKSGMRFKLGQGSKSLSLTLNAAFTPRNRDDQTLQKFLILVGKYFRVLKNLSQGWPLGSKMRRVNSVLATLNTRSPSTKRNFAFLHRHGRHFSICYILT